MKMLNHFFNCFVFLSVFQLQLVCAGTEQNVADLECNHFYVKIFNTASRSAEYTCQEHDGWDGSSVLCSDDRPLPYVIVYTISNHRQSITYYKMCCRTRKCFFDNPYDPFEMFGHANKTVMMHEASAYFDVKYLDDLVRTSISSIIVFSIFFFVFHLLYVRTQITEEWSDDGEEVHPVLLMLAEKSPMKVIKPGLGNENLISVSGEHSLLDYCRLRAARSYRDQLLRESQIIDPQVIRARIVRHDLRLKREIREFEYLRWRLAAKKVKHNRRFVKLNDKWVFVTNDKLRKNWLTRSQKLLLQLGIQRARETEKMHLEMVTKSHFDTAYMDNFDKYDVAHLMGQCFQTHDMHMMFFNATVLGHVPTHVDKPLGPMTHKTLFESLFYHGPYFYPWRPHQLINLFTDAKELFLQDNLCLTIALPAVVIGDIRGRYVDLHRWIDIVGLPYRRKILFLGGYVERGEGQFSEFSFDCLAFIAAMKVCYPRHVFMLRGSAETVFSFATRFTPILDDAILIAARQMCECMPLTAMLGEKYLATSSGLSPHMIYDPFSINEYDRPMTPDNLPFDVKRVLFGQPSPDLGIFDHNPASGRFRFGLQAVDDVCASLNIKAIIRSRNELTVNPLLLRNGRLVTISSCPTEHSSGVAMVLDEGLGWIFLKLRLQTDDEVIDSVEDSVSIEDEVNDSFY
ncbi:unnamed protein product [Caenorhabditis sp. 36 PRJEB53466]|nr:unnamed protein product [Caenorhabditis sp. 36 PRJEB53466]